MIQTFPAVTPKASTWGPVWNSHSMTSPFNGSTQSIEMPGMRWRTELTFENLQRDNRYILQAFLLSLRGSVGRFYLHDHSYKRSILETPLVAGAGQTGRTLNVDGLTASITNIIPVGSRFAVDNEVKVVTQSVDSDGLGAATITFEPPLRAKPLDNTPLILTNPTAIMRLVEDSVPWSNVLGGFMNISFACEESFFDSLDALTWG